MSWLWDQKAIKDVDAQLEKERAERELRREQARVLDGASPSFRNRFRREFLLPAPVTWRKHMVRYILSIIGVLLLLLGGILASQ